jgi:hypothetical protein
VDGCKPSFQARLRGSHSFGPCHPNTQNKGNAGGHCQSRLSTSALSGPSLALLPDKPQLCKKHPPQTFYGNVALEAAFPPTYLDWFSSWSRESLGYSNLLYPLHHLCLVSNMGLALLSTFIQCAVENLAIKYLDIIFYSIRGSHSIFPQYLQIIYYNSQLHKEVSSFLSISPRGTYFGKLLWHRRPSSQTR